MKLRTDKTAGYAIGQLREIKQALGTPRTANTHPASARYAEDLAAKIQLYLSWASTAERQLRRTFADTDLVDGLFGERYWRIGQLTERSIYAPGIIGDEIWHQEQRITEAIETLTEWRKLSQRSGELLVLDTGTLLECRPYNQIPWTTLTGCAQVRLVLTMPVIDALEADQRSDDGRLKEPARSLLPKIDAAFGDGEAEFIPVEKDGREMSGVTLEVLRDQPGYHPATSEPDEAILDRAEFLQQATGRPVTVVTTGTARKLRCRTRREHLKQLSLPEEHRLRDTDKPAVHQARLINGAGARGIR